MRLVAIVVAFLLCCQCAFSVIIKPDNYCGYNPAHSQEGTYFDRVKADLNLVHASVLIRHGDRTPVSHATTYGCWPKSPVWSCDMAHEERPKQSAQSPSSNSTTRLHAIRYLQGRNYNPGNCGQGRLTTKGYLQQIHNGQVLRSLYVDQYKLLPPTFQVSDFFVRATDVPRTQLSAESLFQGLYPPSNSTPCNIQMLEIQTMDSMNENMYPNPQLCPAINTLQKQWERSTTFQQYNASIIAPLLQKLSTIYGLPAADIDYQSVQDCFQAHACHQLDFPNGMTQDVYTIAIEASTYYYKGLMETISQKNNRWVAIAMGQFVADIVKHIDAVIAGTAMDKLALYSAHDTTLMPWLAAYGIWDGVWPPYASVIRLQLYQDNDNKDFFVSIYYNDQLLTLPGCDSVCPYSTFRNMSSNIMSAFTTECTSRRYQKDSYDFSAN